MPAILASIEYLADLDLYKNEKPFSGLLINGKKFFETGTRLDNVEFDYVNCKVRDARECPHLRFEESGFKYVQHKSETLSEFDTVEKVETHKPEIAEFLTREFDALYVKTYDCHTRANVEKTEKTVDVFDDLAVDFPAAGAHNDITLKSGPEVVFRNFTPEEKEKYLIPGNRIRIINTWRPLRPVCEDRPLAVCDASTIVTDDLIAADRLYPHTIGEIFYLKPNANHQWYWLEKQTIEDVLIMTMYDTHPGGNARYCPHISFENSRAAPGAPPRTSIESRNIVVTRIGQ